MVTEASNRGKRDNKSGFVAVDIVSIPSGRGFWAGSMSSGLSMQRLNGLNPLWSGLLGRPMQKIITIYGH